MSEREDKAIETICVPIGYLHELEELKTKEQEDDDGTTDDTTTGDAKPSDK